MGWEGKGVKRASLGGQGKYAEVCSLTLGVPAAMASFRMELLLPREKRTRSVTKLAGKEGSASRDLMRSNSKAHCSSSLDQQEPPHPAWRDMGRRAVPTISPAVTKWSYEWKSPNQPHESNTDSPSVWGLQSSSPSTGKKQRASLQGHREESQGEGRRCGEPCEGSGTMKKGE